MTKLRPFLLLFLAAFIPVLLIVTVWGTHVLRGRQQGMSESIAHGAGHIGALLSQELRTQIELLSILSESPRLDPPMQPAKFAELAGRLRARVDLWDMIRVAVPDGTVISSSPPRPASIGRTAVDAESHLRLMETGAPVVGNLVKGPNGSWAFPIRVPVKRAEETVYVLSAIIRPERMAEFLTASGLPVGWQAWIVDGTGHVLAATGPASGLADSDRAAPFIPGPGSGETEQVELGGEAFRIARASVRGSEWSAFVGMPEAVFQAPLRRAFQMLAATALLAVLLAAAAVLLFSREFKARRQQERSLAESQRLDALGKLTGGVAHDFNNLLMSFQSGLEIIRRSGGDSERTGRIVEMMFEAVDRGKGMTQRLLAFSRRSDHSREVFRLQQRLPTATPLLAQAARDDIELSIDVADDTWPVDADPQAFEVALINLVSNARDAMPGGGAVAVAARNLPDGRAVSPEIEGPHVAITVTDTGIGIDAADLGRVFEPFFTTKGGAAPGLGLSQVYGFARRSGGIVRAASVPGRGSAFTIYLPRARAEAPPARSKEAQAPAAAGRVLVVDDTPSAGRAAQLMLEAEGYDTALAESGKQALALLSSDASLELLLCDVMMPGMSGLELAPIVRERYPHVRIVLMTGYSDMIERGLDPGLPILSKPFKVEELREAISLAQTEASKSDGAKVVQLRRNRPAS